MNAFNYIRNAFLLIDIFGKKTEFQIDQKQKFTTMSGGLFSLIYFAFTFFLFFSFGSDMINRVNPETNVSQLFESFPSETLVSRDSYFFMFGMQDKNAEHFIDEQIYTVIFTQAHKKISVNIPIEPCTIEHLPLNPKLNHYFQEAAGPLKNLYCIQKEFDNHFSMKGSWDQAEFDELQIHIDACVNSTERTCKSEDNIKKMLKSGYFAFYSVDYLFDLLDYEQPAKKYGKDYYIPTTNNVKKIIVRHLKTNHLKTDDGWIIDQTNEKQIFSFDYDKESFELLEDTDSFVDFSIRKSNYETAFTRRYKKIQNVLAEMTGFLQIIFIVLFVLSNPFIKKEYYETLTNSIYNFEVDENKEDDRSISKSQIPTPNPKKKFAAKKSTKNIKKEKKGKEDSIQALKSIINIPEGDHELNGSHFKISAKQKKDNDKLVNHFFKLKERPLNLTMMEILKSNFVQEPELNIKKHQRITGIKSIFSQLDVKFILKKFAEIDKIKMLLLNEDQYPLFDYLPKPMILKDSKIHLNFLKSDTKSPFKKSSEIIHDENDIVMKAKTVQRAYVNIMKKEKKSDIDLKLIESLDENLLKILEGGELTKSETKFAIEQSEIISRDGGPYLAHHDSVVSDKQEHNDDNGKIFGLHSSRI